MVEELGEQWWLATRHAVNRMWELAISPAMIDNALAYPVEMRPALPIQGSSTGTIHVWEEGRARIKVYVEDGSEPPMTKTVASEG